MSRWGKFKVCCRCSQYGHHSHECRQPNPIYIPSPEKPPEKVEPEEEDGYWYMGFFIKGKKPQQ